MSLGYVVTVSRRARAVPSPLLVSSCGGNDMSAHRDDVLHMASEQVQTPEMVPYGRTSSLIFSPSRCVSSPDPGPCCSTRLSRSFFRLCAKSPRTARDRLREQGHPVLYSLHV